MTLPRLIFVTGKGGTGKSTVAVALALALSRRRPTTLADLDRRRTALRLLAGNGRDASSDAIKISKNLDGIALSSRAELETFIHRIVPLKMISRRMLKSRTFGYVTAALPGLEAFLMLERLRILSGDGALKDNYVVVDGPASGSAIELLSVADGIQGIAPGGTLHRLGASVQSFLTDRDRFGVVLTVTPEEMAVREAIETSTALKNRLGIKWVVAILNGASKVVFDAADLEALTPFKSHADLALRRNAVAEFSIRARDHLKEAGLDVIELPALFAPELGKPEAGQLADQLDKFIPAE
jgi:anion-transporting  ArsA/GET3 family ATPase